MRIWTFTVCWNQAHILPFWLRHYEAIADRMNVWDDHSTDGTYEMLIRHPKTHTWIWPGGDGIDDDAFLTWAYEQYPKAVGQADWVMVVDTDEFVYHPDLKGILEKAKADGYDVVQPDGFNMTHDGLPADDKRQLWEIVPTGFWDSVYSKPVVFRPEIKIRWNRGRHATEHCTPKIWQRSGLKLLHYRYLGFEYTKRMNERNYARCHFRTGDKGAAWSCAPNWHGEHSPEWAEESMKRGVNVLVP